MAVSMIGPKFYAWDRNGKPLAFGRLYSYQARTNTPKPTYQSEDQVVENTNPVILNGEGYANIYLDGAYKMVLKDDKENEIWTSDPVTSANAEEWVNCLTAEYLSPLSFKVPGNFSSEYSKGRRVRLNSNASEYDYATIASSSYAGGFTTVIIYSGPDLVPTGLVESCVSIVSSDSIPVGSDPFAIFASVEDMTASDMQKVTPVMIDAVDVLVKTQGYYGGWAVMIAPQGDAEYLLTTRQKVRDTKSDQAWEPNGTGDHYLFDGTDYVAMIQGGIANVKQYGAKGGDSTVDTPAFVDAMNSTLPVEVPPINFDKAYVISGEIEIPEQSVMYGTSTLKAPATDDDARLTEQAYITFEDASSWFWGGSGENDRVGVYWSDLMFISSGGSDSKIGTAIGRKTGNSVSAMGGNCNRIAFAGFEDGWINDLAYFLDVEGLDLLNNNRGISFDDWNSSSLGTIYGKGGGDYYIDTGGDSARSIIRDFGFNMNSDVKIGIRFEGGVKFSGYGYFEGFGTPTVANQTCIAASVSPFNNSRPVGLENILFSLPEGAYCLTIGGTNDTGNVTWAGTISKCKFNPTQIAPIGYGIHERYDGDPTYPNTTIAGLDLNTCSGITKSDLVGTPYQENPTTLHAFLKENISFTPGTSSYERLPIENVDIVSSNYPELVDESNRAILRNPKTYEVECTLRFENQTETEFLPQARIMYNGVSQDSGFELVPPKSTNNVYKSIVLTAMIDNTSSAGEVYVEARNSCEIIGYSLKIKQIYSEV